MAGFAAGPAATATDGRRAVGKPLVLAAFGQETPPGAANGAIVGDHSYENQRIGQPIRSRERGGRAMLPLKSLTAARTGTANSRL